MKKFYPFYPWQDCQHYLSIMNNDSIPTRHVAEMIGMSKANLETKCKELQIEFVQDPPGVSRRFTGYMKIEDLPTVLRTLDWSEADIEEGMNGLQEIIARIN